MSQEGFLEGAEQISRLRRFVADAQSVKVASAALAKAEIEVAYWQGLAAANAHRIKVLEVELKCRNAALKQLTEELADERNIHSLGLDSHNAVASGSGHPGDAADSRADLHGQGASKL